MPELPEVEAARRALEEHCTGKKIQKCTVADDSKVIHGVSSEDFEAALVGKTIVAAHRKGKNMWLELDSPPFPSFQFGMAGAVYIKGVAVTKYKRSAVKDTDEWPSKYSKLFVESFISGIGNWMADEVLYQARIHPIQTASSMSKETCATLLKCINEVIATAVEVGADSSQFPSNWIFHSREKKPGKAFIDGKRIEFIDAGGRTSAFVPELQKLPSGQAVKETGKRSKGKTASKGRGGDESEDEDKPEKAKATKGKTNSAKKPSSKKKLGASVEASDEDEDGYGSDDGSPSPKRERGAKNPTAKRNPKGGKKIEAEMRKTGGRSGPSKRKQEGSDDADDDDDVSEGENGKQVKAVAASKKKKKAN